MLHAYARGALVRIPRKYTGNDTISGSLFLDTLVKSCFQRIAATVSIVKREPYGVREAPVRYQAVTPNVRYWCGVGELYPVHDVASPL